MCIRDSAWPKSRLLAWVLMPDHWHGLVELGDEALPLCIARLKALSTRDLRKHDQQIGLVWGRGYHDRALRSADSLAAAARYLVMNPVRAGIVGRLGQSPSWDALWVETARG